MGLIRMTYPAINSSVPSGTQLLENMKCNLCWSGELGMLLREDEEGRLPLQGRTKWYLGTECTLGSRVEVEEAAELTDLGRWSQQTERAVHIHTHTHTQLHLSGLRLLSYDGQQSTVSFMHRCGTVERNTSKG